MKPLKLVMRAFGPYAGEVTIDFEKLDGRNLFLICGPTGAGKTTILDAMCYALYGETSGGRDGARMRSDYAGGDQKTEVIFDFMLGEKTYRACRSPEQWVNKKRGTGLTKNATQSAFSELENGKEINTIRSDVAKVAEEKIGLDAKQFCQVILLPQGDFRKLLIATAGEREKIMKKLFHIEQFSDFKNVLEGRVKALYKVSCQETADLQGCYKAAGVAESEEALKTAIAETTASHESATKEEAETKKKLADFQSVYNQAHLLAARFASLHKAEHHQKELEGEKKGIEEKSEALARIRSARELKPYEEQLEKIIEEGLKAKKKKDAAEKERLHRLAEKEKLEIEEKELESHRGEVEAAKKTITELELWKPKAREYGMAQKKAADTAMAYKQAERALEELRHGEEMAEKTCEKSRAAYEEIHARYIFGQAAILASRLKEGEPCPVCGSIHHPHPAVSEETLPTEAAVKKAQKDAEMAEKKQKDAADKRQAYESKDFTQARIDYEKAQTVLEGLADIPEAYRDVRFLESESRRLTRLVSDWESAVKALSKNKETVSNALGAAESSYKYAAEDRERLIKEYQDEATRFETKAQEMGFSGMKDCQSWYKRINEEEKLERLIRDYDADVKATEQKLEEERLAVRGKTEPDMDALEREGKALNQVHDSTLQRISSAKERLKALENIRKQVAVISERHEKTEKEYALAQGLYILVLGSKQNRITLERYVLGTLLDQVAKAASQRLLKISHQRYALRRSTEQKGSDGGLALEVSDSYTGRSRPANTLSGGETFLASLSLALGLSDVVQARQGGVHLDTMFIDEGFGTLDPESLNSAMNTLIDLQNTGRLVGIISHVPELEERIDARLKVTPAEKGSTAEFEILE